MDDVASAPPPTSQKSYLLRLRNSISTPVVIPLSLPTSLHHQSSNSCSSAVHHQSSNSCSSAVAATTSSPFSSSFPGDFDVISVKPISYTSLKDLLPSTSVNSPKSNSPSQTGSEISIKNRLVKQAACAYLQPMSTSPDSSTRSFLHRLWNKLQLLKNPIFAALRDFFRLHIFRRLNHAIDWLLRAIRIRSFS